MAVVLADGYEPAVPLSHARIGWATVATEANVSASGAKDGYPASAPVNPLTWDRWLPDDLPAWWQVDAGEAVTVDHVGIAAHALADGLLTVTVQHSDDGEAWTDVVAHEPADNAPILLLFAPVSARWWRLLIDGGSPQAVGVVNIGQVLAMPRPVYGGIAPPALSRSMVVLPQRSEQGQFLGRTVIRGGIRSEIAWRHLPAAWYRSTFDPFVAAALERPFFLAWRPSAFPEDVAYAWTTSDIVPANMGVRDFMQVSVAVEGIATEPRTAFVFDLDESHPAAANEVIDLSGWELDRFSAVVSWTATGSEAESTRAVEWNDGTSSNQVNLSHVGANVALNVVTGGGFEASLALGPWTAGEHIAAIRLAPDDVAGSLDGAAVVTDTSATIPPLDALLVAHSLGPTLELGGSASARIRLTSGVLGDAHLLSYSGGA